MAVVFLSTFMFPHRFVFVVMSSVFLCLPAKLVSLVSFLFVFWVNNRLCSCFDHFAKHVMLVEEASAFCLLKLASYPCCSTVFGAAHLLKDFHTTLLIRPLLLRTGGVASLVPSIMAQNTYSMGSPFLRLLMSGVRLFKRDGGVNGI